jgi:hypothetical protein
LLNSERVKIHYTEITPFLLTEPTDQTELKQEQQKTSVDVGTAAVKESNN